MNDSGLPDPSTVDASADAPPQDVTQPLPDVDHMTLGEFVRSYAFRMFGLWLYTMSLLLTTLALLNVPLWKGLVASFVLSLGTVGKKVWRSVAIYGRLSRVSLSVAMAEAPDDLQSNYTIQQQYNYASLQDQPKGV